MSTFKPGDRIRRISDPLENVPIGFETVAVEPDPVSSAHDVVWFKWPGRGRTKVHSKAGSWELVPDEPALPVRTRTVTEIAPGTYGSILISEPGDYAVFIRMHIEDHGKFYDAAQLRAAARIFTSLAEALEWSEYK
jgi:hypothetical protein